MRDDCLSVYNPEGDPEFIWAFDECLGVKIAYPINKLINENKHHCNLVNNLSCIDINFS